MFVAKSAGAEVNGETVNSIVVGMGAFKAKALEILSKNGIKDPKSGMWYSQQNWLNAFKEIAAGAGAPKSPPAARRPISFSPLDKMRLARDCR